jgi:hypothetical protein
MYIAIVLSTPISAMLPITRKISKGVPGLHGIEPLACRRITISELRAPHKVLIYIEHHSECPLVGIGTPPPL